MREEWAAKSFEDCLERVDHPAKVQRRNFQATGKFAIISQESDFINGYWDVEDEVLRVDRPLVVFGDHTQVLKYIDFDFVLGADGVKLLKPKSFIEPKFLYYFLMAHPIEGVGYARHYRFLKELTVTYPPIPEQQRIVAILDEAFAGLATATANAEKNLKNARELFESHLNSVFSETAGKGGEKRLSELCREMTVGHVGPMAKRYKPCGIPFLRSQNIRPFEVELDDVVYIDEGFHRELRKSQLQPGDVVIVRTGYPGTAAVVPDELEIANCADLVIVRCGDQLDPRYVAAFFNSSYGKHLVSGNLNGAAQKHFNVTSAKGVKIALPSKSEQGHRVREVEAYRAQCLLLEMAYKRKQQSLADLKQSILQKAFAGELTSPPSLAIKEAAE